MPDALTLTPIGIIHTPFKDRVSAPRQAFVASHVRGTLVLSAGKHFEDALSDIEGWEYLWVLYWLHLNTSWRPKVLPPRSAGKRRGVFATRSPHRPNPIGLSVVKLEKARGLVLHVRGVDMLDNTPLLDIKPYVPAADAIVSARTGWLGAQADPEPDFEVLWSEDAEEQARWLNQEHGIDLVTPVECTLRLGPQPHAYRRIRRLAGAMQLAVKDWRIRFHVKKRTITVDAVATGYAASQLKTKLDATLDPHRAFASRYG